MRGEPDCPVLWGSGRHGTHETDNRHLPPRFPLPPAGDTPHPGGPPRLVTWRRAPPHKAPGSAGRAARPRAPPSAPPRRPGPRGESRSRAARGGRCDPGSRGAVRGGAARLGSVRRGQASGLGGREGGKRTRERERDSELGKDVAEAGGGAPEKRLQAVGHAEEQRLLHPAATSGPRRRRRPLHGYLVARGAHRSAGPSRAGRRVPPASALPRGNLTAPGRPAGGAGCGRREQLLCSARGGGPSPGRLGSARHSSARHGTTRGISRSEEGGGVGRARGARGPGRRGSLAASGAERSGGCLWPGRGSALVPPALPLERLRASVHLGTARDTSLLFAFFSPPGGFLKRDRGHDRSP